MRWMMGIALVVMAVMGGCAVAKPPDFSAYRPYVAHMPRSILVLPPVNYSANIHATDAFLSTVTVPLAESGYYVYPIAVVDRLFKDNGVPTAGDMQSIPLSKIDEVIGPDAVLYINIRQWTTTYVVIDSTTRVRMEYKLVDTKSGEVLWKQEGTYAYSSSQAASGSSGVATIVIMTVAAQIHAAAAASSDGAYERAAATQANAIVFYGENTGLLKGARSPEYAKDQQRIREALAKQAPGITPVGAPN